MEMSNGNVLEMIRDAFDEMAAARAEREELRQELKQRRQLRLLLLMMMMVWMQLLLTMMQNMKNSLKCSFRPRTDLSMNFAWFLSGGVCD
jgi:hypothetical protein